jgi:hypothetical protein
MMRSNLILIGLGALSIYTAQAATRTVTQFDDASLDGVCDAQCTLRDALAAAQSGDVIVWSSGLPELSLTQLTQGPLSITTNVTINGPGARKLAIDATDSHRIFEIAASANTVNLNDLSLILGKHAPAEPGADAEGGCLFSDSTGSLNLRQVAMQFCSVSGSNGAMGMDIGQTGQTGGDVRGAAIFHRGALTLSNASILDSAARAGSGGTGGPNDPFMPGSMGGIGGTGGSVEGGVIHALGELRTHNVTLANVDVNAFIASGNGGNSGPFSIILGAPPGAIQGGVIRAALGSRFAFSTIDRMRVLVGTSITMFPTSISGAVLFVGGGAGTTQIRGSALIADVTLSPNGGSADACAGDAAPGVTDSFYSQPCFGLSANNPGGLFESAPIMHANGIATLPPVVGGLAVDGVGLANCLDSNGQSLTRDARGEVRPFGNGCDIGAHEVDDVLLRDGFE